MFRAGQKVVCVDAVPRYPEDKTTFLEEGAVYTVVSTFETWAGDGVTLNEFSVVDGKRGWHADRFRPAVERKTDISVFKAMLKTTKMSEDA